MLYCPPNVTFSDIWVKHGLSHCFLDTITSSTYGLFLLVFGLGQWAMYRRYASPSEGFIRGKSTLLIGQIALSAFLPVLAGIQLVLLATLIGDKTICGYELVYFISNVLVWPLSIRLVLLERHYQLPTVPSNGHGIVLLLFWTLVFVAENLTFINLKNENWWFDLSNTSDKCEFGLFVVRYVSSCLLFVIGIKAPGVAIDTANVTSHFTPLVNGESEEQGAPGSRPTNSTGSTFSDMFAKLRTLLPFLWPAKDNILKLNVLACLLMLTAGRVLNVFVPIFYKLIVDRLGGDGNPPTFCWQLVLGYVGLKFLNGGGFGGMGLLNNLRYLAWIKVQQYTSREVQLSLFSHLHGLSLRWHLGRKTGEVLRVMDRGTSSINSLLNYIIFSIAPTIIDLIVAICFFTAAFNYIFGFIVFITMTLYLVATIVVTEWRTKYRRSMNLTDNEQRTKGVDSLLNFETVKYYGAEQYEVDRYRAAIVDYQVQEFKSNGSLSVLNSFQNLVINGGFLVGSLLCAYYVAHGKQGFTVGDYVLFASYINQLYMPLNWFGTYYRMIQQNFIDMENMFDLLKEDVEVRDKPDAEALILPEGHLEFRDVSFHYNPEKPILKNVSFVVPPGKTLAIVGGTGEGKSTIIRLVFRFYDVTGGQILVDGRDIRDYTQQTVRECVGVVPQDTVLFNDTIKYNIKYGKLVSTDQEVEDAAKYAEIHDKILNFPDKYETKVGERGLKLSGGEKQRVAIARTILKGPSILLLDEATSALDTKTERNIQNALTTVCRGRTVIVVAHRLSTVVGADCILVLKEGTVVEQGSHDELMTLDRVYADMWNQQLQAVNSGKSEGSGSAASDSLAAATLEKHSNNDTATLPV